METIFKALTLLVGLIITTTFVVFGTGFSDQIMLQLNTAAGNANSTVERAMESRYSNYYNKPDVSGDLIVDLVKRAGDEGISVVVQTAASDGILINYGVALRTPNNSDLQNYKGQGVSGKGATTFETNFAFTAAELFKKTSAGSDLNSVSVSKDEEMIYTFSPASETYTVAAKNNEDYDSTGFLYTNSINKKGVGVNKNYSYLENPTSPYFINTSSTYRVVGVLNPQGACSTFVVEENTVAETHNAVESIMKGAGLIND